MLERYFLRFFSHVKSSVRAIHKSLKVLLVSSTGIEASSREDASGPQRAISVVRIRLNMIVASLCMWVPRHRRRECPKGLRLRRGPHSQR